MNGKKLRTVLTYLQMVNIYLFIYLIVYGRQPIKIYNGRFWGERCGTEKVTQKYIINWVQYCGVSNIISKSSGIVYYHRQVAENMMHYRRCVLFILQSASTLLSYPDKEPNSSHHIHILYLLLKRSRFERKGNNGFLCGSVFVAPCNTCCCKFPRYRIDRNDM